MPRNQRPFRLASILLLVIGLAAAGCGQPGSEAGKGFVPQPGDLLFQDTDGHPLCDAIEKVTTGFDGANVTHVGIVAEGDGPEPVVIEAVSAGVVCTPLQEFLARSLDAEGRPKVAVGRLAGPRRELIPSALRHARELVGAPYDKVFAIDNDAYYCSELVYTIFLRANRGTAVFALEPMTFKDPDTGKTFPAWQEYFAELGQPIPQGRPGINPGGISRAPAVTIVHQYGRLSRKRGPEDTPSGE